VGFQTAPLSDRFCFDKLEGKTVLRTNFLGTQMPNMGSLV